MLFDHNTGQGHLRSPEKGKKHDLELRYMFLDQIFTKNAKNDNKTLFEASKTVKNKIRKITVSPEMTRKSLFWHVLRHISPFLKILTVRLSRPSVPPPPEYQRAISWAVRVLSWTRAGSFRFARECQQANINAAAAAHFFLRNV